jgi:hypothetical protein
MSQWVGRADGGHGIAINVMGGAGLDPGMPPNDRWPALEAECCGELTITTAPSALDLTYCFRSAFPSF